MEVPPQGIRLNSEPRSTVKLCLAVVMVLCGCSTVLGEVDLPNRFRKFGRGNDVLPADKIVEIHRGSYGFMWFGTQRGLIRFDGQNIRWYRHDPDDEQSLSSDDIQAIFEDHKERLWIGTMAGLNLLDRKTGKVRRFPLDQWDKGISQNIWSLAETKQGLWIGTDKGLWCWQDSLEQLSRVAGVTEVSALAVGANGRMLIGTDGQGLAWLAADAKDTHNLPWLSSSQVLTLQTDRDNRFWVGTTRGVFVLSPNAEIEPKKVNLPLLERGKDEVVVVGQLSLDHRGCMWIGTDKGLFVWERDHVTAFNHEPSQAESLSHDRILSVAADEQGVLWVATGAHGIDQLNLKYDNLGFRPVEGKEVQSMTFDADGNLWVGTKRGGLARIKNATDSEPEWFLTDEMIRDVALARAGHLWVATERGLFSLNPTSMEIREEWLQMRVWCLREGDDDTLFLGTDQGVFSFRRDVGASQLLETDLPESERLANSIVTCLLIDHHDDLWIGTFGGGLYHLKQSSEVLTRYDTDHGPARLTANNVMDLALDSRQRLWIATLSGGVNRFDIDQGHIKHLSTKQGFPDNAVVGVLEDNSGRIWANSAVGLVRFDEEGNHFTVFTIRDGNRLGGAVPGARMIDRQNGWLFFGGTGGMVQFQPTEVEWPVLPPLVFTGLTRRGGSARHLILPGETVDLDPEQAPFSLSYAVLDYLGSERVQYAYLREAVDSEWVETQTNSPVTFTGYLKLGGHDRLRVRAESAMFGRLEADLSLNMAAPYWVNWLPLWITLVVLVLGIAIYFWIATKEAVRRKKLEQRAALAEERRRLAEERATFAERREGLERDERVRQETFALVVQEHLDQVSTEIADSLHDGPLSLLQGVRFRLKDMDLPAPALPTITEITEVVLPQINQTLRQVCGRLLKPKLAQGMGAELEQMFRSLRENHPEWRLGWSFDERIELLDSVQQIRILRIFRTLLNNVAKHARASEVTCRFDVEDDEAQLCVRDDGIGFEVPEDLYWFKDRKHYGLYIVGYFAGSMGGDLQIESTRGEGTLVRVSFPWRGRTHDEND